MAAAAGAAGAGAGAATAHAHGATSGTSSQQGFVLESELTLLGRVVVGSDATTAASWSVSSAKPGNQASLLRDRRCDTFWQSDGNAPHTITVQFERRVVVSDLALYIDYAKDESYTPHIVMVRVGPSLGCMAEILRVELPEATGWVRIPLRSASAASAAQSTGAAAAAALAAASELGLAEIAARGEGEENVPGKHVARERQWLAQSIFAASPAYATAVAFSPATSLGASTDSASAAADLLLHAFPPPGHSGRGEAASEAGMTLLATTVLQVSILTMRHSGRDAHLRQLCILAPAQATISSAFAEDDESNADSEPSETRGAFGGSGGPLKDPFAATAAAALGARARQRRKFSADMLQYASLR